MLRTITAALVVFALTGSASAQQIGTLPGVQRVPEDLVASLQLLQKQQLDSLQRFTNYLEQRVKDKTIPPGLHWNARAIYVEAQAQAERDPQEKRLRLAELAEIYEKRQELDARTPNDTWFGVNRLKLGELMRREFEAFRRETAPPPPVSPR